MFTKKQTDSVTSFQEESKNIFNVFTETVNRLSTINSKIENASENRKVKANELILFSLLYQECEADAVYKKGLNYLYKRTNTTKHTVLRCLSVLIDRNLITKKQGTNRNPSEYHINYQVLQQYIDQ